MSQPIIDRGTLNRLTRLISGGVRGLRRAPAGLCLALFLLSWSPAWAQAWEARPENASWAFKGSLGLAPYLGSVSGSVLLPRPLEIELGAGVAYPGLGVFARAGPRLWIDHWSARRGKSFGMGVALLAGAHLLHHPGGLPLPKGDEPPPPGGTMGSVLLSREVTRVSPTAVAVLDVWTWVSPRVALVLQAAAGASWVPPAERTFYSGFIPEVRLSFGVGI